MWDYNTLSTHRTMLKDRVRCEAFRKAIFAAVKPGDVVLDVGAGTGILSIFAAQAGAKKVYAVERARIVEFARQVVRKNNVQDRIEIIYANMEAIELPEKVDAIVSEWLGCLGVDENLLPTVLTARDQWLKPDGKMLPEIVTTWLAPSEDLYAEDRLERWRTHPYGIDLSLMAHGIAQEMWPCQNDIKPEHCLAAPQQLWTTDVCHCSREETESPLRASLKFSAKREGKLSQLAGWFYATFPDGTVLTNAPDAPDTHWGRAQFNLERVTKVEPGTEITVEFGCEPIKSGQSHFSWSVRVGDGSWMHQDTRKGWSY
ncbi:50S ribosomal protein L11 methyltransferase [Candidatus Acetothermia bacterium]|nr:50S ribosomal protein L11 methyltransferase [Candidatus Acetothermia bacterium]